MVKASIVTLAVLVAAAPLATSAASTQAGSKVFALRTQNGSQEYGTVALKPDGAGTDVEIHIVNAPAGVGQPAHIHMGSCAKLDPVPKYPLQTALDGVSETVVNVPIATLLASPMAVNVHKSADDLKTYVACADLAPASHM